jgi:hypothetical protein
MQVRVLNPHLVAEEKAPKGGEDKIINELKDMQGEFAQLSELEEMERSYAEKVIESLKVIQAVVDDTIPIERAALGPKFKYVKEAYLASDAVVILMGASGIQSAIPLSRFKSNEILAVVQSATPHLKKLIAQRRSETGERVELLERILKEVKKAGTTLKEPARESSEAREPRIGDEEDLISSALAKEL